MSERREITSLGRGGSDTSAVALAAALGAEYAEICSDVDGVYTADPRQVDTASKINTLSYEEMQALADGGAKVVHAEAVEWARRNQIEIICSATDGGRAQGTRILAESEGLSHPKVVAVTRYDSLVVMSPVRRAIHLRPILKKLSLPMVHQQQRCGRYRALGSAACHQRTYTASTLFVRRFKSCPEHHCAKI